MFTTLNARLADPVVMTGLRDAWDASRRLRIDDVLAPGLAEAIVEAASEHAFEFFEKHVNEVHGVFWRQLQRFVEPGGRSTFGPIDAAERLFQVELPALVSAITGQALRASGGDGFAVDYYTRGSYLDAHTDQGADRLIAYVVGLTREAWPAEDGGHLEFLEPDELTVRDSIAPGWNTLDLFCVYPLLRPHRVPLLHRQVTRLSINGWLSGELKGPGED